MTILKIHIPELPQTEVTGELKHILTVGVQHNPATQLCNSASEADYVFLDFRHFQLIKGQPYSPTKTIVVDFSDAPHYLCPLDTLLYFKRSVIDRKTKGFVEYPRQVVPISYCVKEAYLNKKPFSAQPRDIDIAAFFDGKEHPEEAKNYYRSAVSQYIIKEFGHLNIKVGIVGEAGRTGRNRFQREYFETMTRAKIVVTCNPGRWEGDYRLFEALSSGCLVLSDKMLTPVENPLVDGEHLIYYDRDNLDSLGEALTVMLEDDSARNHMADNGYAHAMSLHTPSARIDEILRWISTAKQRVKNPAAGGDAG